MESLADRILKALHAEKIERSKAGGLYSAVDEIAQKLGIKSPDIFIPSDRVIHFDPVLDAFSNHENAGCIAKDKIIISKALLKLFDSEDLKKPISPELKATIGHEMHHCANRNIVMAAKTLPIFALPIVAVMATYLYDRAKKKAEAEKDISPKNVAKHIDESAKKAEKVIDKKSGKSPDATENTFLKQVLNAGKYIALAAIGLGAGLYITRHGARFSEFAADRFGAKVAGKDAMTNALKKLHAKMDETMSELSGEQSFIGRIVLETVAVHPSLKERTAYIHSM